jgi:serine/threonine protein kinase/formylglycine-generating enzyme required for sulfatase activity
VDVPLVDAAATAAPVANASQPTSGEADDAADPPRRIGAYRIVRLLGRGGFGSVFLGEDSAPEPRQVAIKLLNHDLNTKQFLRRFEAEREALQRMDHPGIAQILTFGQTSAHRPYFVMEYVPGDHLTLHCKRHNLAMRARIDLFLQVLDAVAHAHQKGVLHRDLSTNNVLVAEVRGRPQPKIIDFGLAKSLASPLQGSAVLTMQGTMMGTPEYMSPEQARGELASIDTRTDVYSLGVLLYELLTDQLPVPRDLLRAQGVAGIAQVVTNHQPARPSQIAPRRSRARLRGDLDWITLKALAKSRDDRYATATEFANDLRRHLQNKPVLAGPPGGFYQFRKFVRRHLAGVTLSLSLLLGILFAMTFSVSMWLEAQDARADLQEMHEVLQAKAETGFRLLADEDRLIAATSAVQSFSPPWPEKIPAMEDWLVRYGQKIDRELSRLQDKRTELEALRGSAANGRLPAEDQHLLSALLRLEGRMQQFTSAEGELGQVRRLLSWSRDIAQRALSEHAEAWSTCAQQVKQQHGFELLPQPGLVPLGANPHTHLQEFLDLASHGKDEPLPSRDPNTGELQFSPRCGIVFVLVAPGTLRMGAQREIGLPQRDPFAQDAELGGDQVMLSEFLLAATELTRSQWRALGGDDQGDDPQLPATGIDWDTAGVVLGRWGMALPTEAQWEYACRAGTTTPWWKGSEATDARAVGNFGAELQRIARLEPNAFGFYDVHGNAAEWCADGFLPFAKAKARNGDGLRLPPPPVRNAERRIVRGGSAVQGPEAARCAARNGESPQSRNEWLGLRPMRSLLRR